MSNELKKFIDDLPGEEGWWAYGDDKFRKAAIKMLGAGMAEDTIKEILQSLFNAVRGEYGD